MSPCLGHHKFIVNRQASNKYARGSYRHVDIYVYTYRPIVFFFIYIF